ncbi:MAG TPA: Rrf2 family transcriptional regulator [Gammaproteobacteria bacterium]
MQLTRYTDYSLRVLIFVALREEGTQATINEICDRFGMPRNHLIKVVQRLGRLGYLRTQRGKGGGLRLGKPAEEIVIGDVVQAMEPNLDIAECTSPDCPLLGGCQLRSVFDEALAAFLAVLSRHTLADLINQPARLRTMLDIHVTS